MSQLIARRLPHPRRHRERAPPRPSFDAAIHPARLLNVRLPVLPCDVVPFPTVYQSATRSVVRAPARDAAMVAEGSIFRLWEFSKMSLAAWAVAGSIGYVLCAARHAPRADPSWSQACVSAAAAHRMRPIPLHADIRPKLYPRIEYERARVFTPKEVEEWNNRQRGAAGRQ